MVYIIFGKPTSENDNNGVIIITSSTTINIMDSYSEYYNGYLFIN